MGEHSRDRIVEQLFEGLETRDEGIWKPASTQLTERDGYSCLPVVV